MWEIRDFTPPSCRILEALCFDRSALTDGNFMRYAGYSAVIQPSDPGKLRGSFSIIVIVLQ